MVKIISDSSTLFSSEEARRAGFDIAPLSVTVNGMNFKEYDKLTTPELIKKISKGYIPKSSQPAVGDFVDLYNKYPEDDIIVITMSSGLSGTYNSACLARSLCDNPDNITIVNSRTLCGPQREMVLNAVRLAKAGEDKNTILSAVNTQINNTYSYLIPRDFTFLKRGGRLNPLAAEIGKLINLVPVLTLSKDFTSLVSFTRQRSIAKAVNKIITYLKNKNVNENYSFQITHADSFEEAEIVKNYVYEAFPDCSIDVMLLSPVFTTQGGPKCIAIQTVLK